MPVEGNGNGLDTTQPPRSWVRGLLSPGTGRPMRIGLVVAAAALAGVLLWLLLIRPGLQREEAARATATATLATGQVAAARDAGRVVVDVMTRDATIDVTTRSNRDAILSAPGAADQLPPDVAHAGRRALCLRAVYRDDPACAGLRDARP